MRAGDSLLPGVQHGKGLSLRPAGAQNDREGRKAGIWRGNTAYVTRASSAHRRQAAVRTWEMGEASEMQRVGPVKDCPADQAEWDCAR